MRSIGADQRVQVEPIYTSLPSGVDGQIINFLADATNGVVWRLRYRAASASIYKWEFTGGSALRANVEPIETTNANAMADLATVGPAVTVALAGVYRASFSATMYNNTVGQFAVMGVTVGTTVAPNEGLAVVKAAAANFDQTEGRTSEVVATAPNTVVKAQYYTTGTTTATFLRREINVTPVRVG